MSIFQETNIDDKSSEYFRPFPNSDIYCMPRSGLEEKVREREKERQEECFLSGAFWEITKSTVERPTGTQVAKYPQIPAKLLPKVSQ